MNKIMKFAAGVSTGLVGFSLSAHAALPEGVTTAISDAQADGQTLGYLLLGMGVVVGVIFWLKRKV